MMKYSIEFSPDQKIVRVSAEGIVNRQGIADFHRSYLTHEQWRPGTHVLIDFMNVDMSGFGAADIEFISNLVVGDREKIGDGKMAILISSENEFGLARMWEMKTDSFVDFRIHVFMDKEEALEWLNREEEPEDEYEL